MRRRLARAAARADGSAERGADVAARAVNAGPAPNSSTVASAAPIVNASTRQSSTRLALSGNVAGSKRVR